MFIALKDNGNFYLLAHVLIIQMTSITTYINMNIHATFYLFVPSIGNYFIPLVPETKKYLC